MPVLKNAAVVAIALLTLTCLGGCSNAGFSADATCDDVPSSSTPLAGREGGPDTTEAVDIWWEQDPFVTMVSADDGYVFASGRSADWNNGTGESPALVVRADPRTGDALATAAILAADLDGVVEAPAGAFVFDDVAASALSADRLFVLWQRQIEQASNDFTLVALDRCTLEILGSVGLPQDGGSVDPFTALTYDPTRDVVWWTTFDGLQAYSASSLEPSNEIAVPASDLADSFVPGSVAIGDDGTLYYVGRDSGLVTIDVDSGVSTPYPGFEGAAGTVQEVGGHVFFAGDQELVEIQGPESDSEPLLEGSIASSFANVAVTREGAWAFNGPNEFIDLADGTASNADADIFFAIGARGHVWGVTYTGDLVAIG